MFKLSKLLYIREYMCMIMTVVMVYGEGFAFGSYLRGTLTIDYALAFGISDAVFALFFLFYWLEAVSQRRFENYRMNKKRVN